jgi:hypothetical protein
MGRYWVWLRNDVSEAATVLDQNQVLDLIAFARIGAGRKTIEMTVRKGGFPSLRAALTLAGDEVFFRSPAADDFRISGENADGAAVSAIGVFNAGSLAEVESAIPENRANSFIGAGAAVPNVSDVHAESERSLKMPVALEKVVSNIETFATDVYSPGSAPYALGSFGSPLDYRIAVVNGDCVLGAGTGYGILIVRGTLTIVDNFNWFGMILVIGQGIVQWSGGNGQIEGAVFVARTRGIPTPSDPSGAILQSHGAVQADFTGALGTVRYSSAQIAAARGRFPYSATSVREY